MITKKRITGSSSNASRRSGARRRKISSVAVSCACVFVYPTVNDGVVIMAVQRQSGCEQRVADVRSRRLTTMKVNIIESAAVVAVSPVVLVVVDDRNADAVTLLAGLVRLFVR